MYDVQFSPDGVSFTTLIAYDNRQLAESLMKACAGFLGRSKETAYWRVRERKAGESLNDPNTKGHS